MFDRVVVAKAAGAQPGLARVLALSDAHIDHLRDRIFPGGCFFACASAEMHARPGAVKDRVAEFDGRWQGRFREHLAIALGDGDLPAEEDVEEVLFDIDAILYYAHGAFSFRDDPAVLEQARDAVRRRLRVA